MYDSTLIVKPLTILFSKQERATGMNTEANALPVYSNWPWKMQSHGVITPVPLLASAASSGFESIHVPTTISCDTLQHPPTTLD